MSEFESSMIDKLIEEDTNAYQEQVVKLTQGVTHYRVGKLVAPVLEGVGIITFSVIQGWILYAKEESCPVRVDKDLVITLTARTLRKITKHHLKTSNKDEKIYPYLIEAKKKSEDGDFMAKVTPYLSAMLLEM